MKCASIGVRKSLFSTCNCQESVVPVFMLWDYFQPTTDSTGSAVYFHHLWRYSAVPRLFCMVRWPLAACCHSSITWGSGQRVYCGLRLICTGQNNFANFRVHQLWKGFGRRCKQSAVGHVDMLSGMSCNKGAGRWTGSALLPSHPLPSLRDAKFAGQMALSHSVHARH